MSFLVLGYSGYSFTRGLLYGSGQVARSTIYDFASALIALLALFTTLAFGVTNLALLLSLSTGYLLYAGLNWPSSHDRPSKDLRRAMDFFVLFGAIGTLASSGFLQLSVIAARLVGGAEGAGQYAAAFTLAVPPSLIAGSVSLLLFPSLSAAWGRGDRMEFRRQTDRALRLLMVTMVSVFGTLTIFAEILIEVAWGAPFRAAGDYLPLLLLALLMNSLGIASVNAIITRSDRGVMVTTATTVAGMLIGVTVWLTLTPTAGVLGVATGYLVGTFLIAGVPTAIVWKTDGHRWGGLFIRLAIGIATLLAAYALVTHFALSWLGTSAMTSLFLAIWLSIMHSECRGIMELIRNQQ